MRAGVLVALLLGVLAGCAEEGPRERVLPVLQMYVEIGGETAFAAGEVLGDGGGAAVYPFRFVDEEKVVLGKIPAGTLQLVAVEQPEAPAVLLADVSRATATPGRSETPAIFEFEHDPRTGEWTLQFVQPVDCGGSVTYNGRTQTGEGPFHTPPLIPGDIVVLILSGGSDDCAQLRVEARPLGAWTIREL